LNIIYATQTIAWIVIILVVLFAGGAYYHLSIKNGASMQQSGTPGPIAQLVSTVHQNQGNMGQPDTGVVQLPMEDGQEDSVIGGNLLLGPTKDETLGSYLVAYNGMTVYTFPRQRSHL